MTEQTPQVVDKRTPLGGALSKRANLIILGVGLIAVLIVFTTSKPHKSKADEETPEATATPTTATTIDDAVRQIAQSLARQHQQQGETAKADPEPYQIVPKEQLPAGYDPEFAGVFGADPGVVPCPTCPGGLAAAPHYGGGHGAVRRAEDTRMASSVALSYRAEAPGRPAAARRSERPNVLTAFQAAAEAPEIDDTSLGGLGGVHADAAPSARPQWGSVPTPAPAADPERVVREGTIIDTVLLNRLDGSFSGPVVCLVSNPIYSWSRQQILIPAGSRVLGQAQRVQDQRQVRLAVTFHRLILPDGSSVDLQQFVGLNQIGDTGLKDRVNHHYLRMFGLSIALGSLSGLAQFGTTGPGWMTGQSFGEAWRQGAGYELANQARQQFTSALNTLPTITIREGHRVKVFLTQDLVIPAGRGQ